MDEFTIFELASARRADTNRNGKLDRAEAVSLVNEYLTHRELTAAAYPNRISPEELRGLKEISASDLGDRFLSDSARIRVLWPNGVERPTRQDFQLIEARTDRAVAAIEKSLGRQPWQNRLAAMVELAKFDVQITSDLISNVPPVAAKKLTGRPH